MGGDRFKNRSMLPVNHLLIFSVLANEDKSGVIDTFSQRIEQPLDDVR